MATLEEARTVVELMVLTAWADGTVQGVEALTVHKLVAANPDLKQVGSTAELSKRAKERLDEIGLEDALRECALRLEDPALRELAFQHCVRVMGADSQLDSEEMLVLGTLQECFGYSNEDVKRLLVLASRQV